MFTKLFSAITLGRTTLPNRIIFGAHRTNLAKRGLVGDELTAYYVRRAQGGCGAVVVGEASLHPGDQPYENMIQAYRPEAAQGLEALAAKIHRYQSLAFLNLNHRGFQGDGAVTRRELWGPSAVGDVVHGETAKPMEAEDVAEAAAAFAAGAALAKNCGFDGVMVDIGSESLLRQFLSLICNHRQDEYGGSLENRLRFPLMVIAETRAAVGADYTLGVSLCMDEQFWGGLDSEAGKEVARALEATGQVDFISATLGTYYNLHLTHPSMHTPEGFAMDLAGQAKEAVSLPVAANHQIPGPGMAEDILVQGKADVVGMVRPLICDPDLPKKAKEGRAGDIRSCVRDNQGCVSRTAISRKIGCILNPEAGREAKLEIPSPADGAKKVMVIGAGPAGLEAAVAAGRRGCRVIVYERAYRPGGQLNLAVIGAGRQGLAAVTAYQIEELVRLGVEVITGREVDLELVRTEKPDAVIVATGSRPAEKPVPGSYQPPEVINVRQALAGEFPIGERVLFVDEDGGHRATATVEILAEAGKQVTMVTSELFIGLDLATTGDLHASRQRLLQKGVVFICDVRIERIEGRVVRGRNKFSNQPVVFDDFDTVVLDMARLPDDALYRDLKDEAPLVLRAGDCVAPRDIGSAIREGRSAGGRV